VGKGDNKFYTASAIFKKLAAVNKSQLGENSPNLVTLVSKYKMASVQFYFFSFSIFIEIHFLPRERTIGFELQNELKIKNFFAFSFLLFLPT
jgi:hypothetical protein